MKKIGIDLDNTIIDYKIPFNFYSKKYFGNKKITKNALKNYLIKNMGHNKWTQAQEEIYGRLITKAQIYDSCKKCLSFFDKNKYEVFIISHKTKKSEFSKKYDLRRKALSWINKNLKGLIKKKNIFFCDTLEKKIKIIKKLNFFYFIDDLPEILLNKDMNNKCNKILFSNKKYKNLICLNHWKKIHKHFDEIASN